MRSALTAWICAAWARMAAAVAGSMVNSKRVAMRTARSSRSLSSSKRRLRIADGAQHAFVQIRLAVDVIDELSLERIEEHAVDGEIAALSILAGRRENDLIGTPAVAVSAVAAKRGHLHLRCLPATRGPSTSITPKLRRRPAERGNRLRTLFGPGIGGDVVVLGHQAEQFVAHAAAGPERFVPGLLETLNNLDGKLAFGHVHVCRLRVSARKRLFER